MATFKGKRKLASTYSNKTNGLESPKKSSLLNEIDNQSPMSSPLKGPLVDGATESGSATFVAKCFYGLKSSSAGKSKENSLSPKKKNVRNTSHLSNEIKPKILQDVGLNEKLLERIAASPVKQAVLQTCSVDEFRKMYRGEIKEIEQEKEYDDRRITRKLSKIVWKQHEDSDNDWEGSSSSDGISFKISNRGFDVDSISNCSSSIKSEQVFTPLKRNILNSPGDSLKHELSSSKKNSVEEKQVDNQIDTPPSASLGRKFFKSKSPGQSVGTSNVLLGKGFNLRFVRENRNGKTKRKKRTNLTSQNSSLKKQSFAEKLRMSSPLGSTVLTGSSPVSTEENTSVETTPLQPRGPKMAKIEKYNGEGFDEDDDLDLVVAKNDNCKTYGLVSPKRTRLDYSSGNESPYDSMSDCSPVMEDVSNKVECNTESAVREQSNQDVAKNDDESSRKLFPIFKTRRASKPTPESSSSTVKSSRPGNKLVKDDQKQMIIDAGQKNFGATQCSVCGMVYCHADPTDETSHAKFHKRLLEVLKFPVWKKERVVQENPVDCSKIILVLSDDLRSHRKKVEEIYEVMGRELGFPGDTPFTNPYRKVFMYVSVDREIEGCCVAEPIKEGNRVIPGDLDSSDASGRRPWCCEKVPEPALMGISRLWVAAQKRRSGVASRLLEAVQQWFDYGSFIPKDKIAFSDPTPDGRRFAHKFTGTPTFLVYKYK